MLSYFFLVASSLLHSTVLSAPLAYTQVVTNLEGTPMDPTGAQSSFSIPLLPNIAFADKNYPGAHLWPSLALSPNVAYAQSSASFSLTVTVNCPGPDGNGGDGADLIIGTNNADIISAGKSDDEVYGCQGDDTINGNEGDDFIDGGEGKDTIKGNEGNDVIVGGPGDDDIDGGADNDILTGGPGKDKFQCGSGTGPPRATGLHHRSRPGPWGGGFRPDRADWDQFAGPDRGRLGDYVPRFRGHVHPDRRSGGRHSPSGTSRFSFSAVRNRG